MVVHCSSLDIQPHGAPARDSIPQITPEIARQLAKESREIRTQFHKRIEKMWDIPLHERQALS